jgi:hypothetical protein
MGAGQNGSARAATQARSAPPASSGGRSSHKSEARISAIADFARKGKREKKALQLSLLTDRRRDNPGAVEKALPFSAAQWPS